MASTTVFRRVGARFQLVFNSNVISLAFKWMPITLNLEPPDQFVVMVD